MAEEAEDNSRRKKRKDVLRMQAAGIRDIVSDAVTNFGQNGDNNQAAAIALYAILSAIPLFILTMIAAGSFFGSNPHIQKDIVRAIQNFQPYFSGDILHQLGHIEGKSKVLGWIGVLGLVWLSAAIFNAIASALNIIFRSQKTRNYFVSKLMAVGMIPAAWFIGGLSVAMSYVAAILAQAPLVLPGDIEVALTLPAQIALRYIIPYVMVVILVTTVYRIVPTAKIRFRVALAGSVVFAFLLEAAKQFFTWYMTHYTRYDVIFGSLQTVVILVIWVFYIALIFLFCAEVMSSYERRDVLLLERAFLKSPVSGSQVDERLYKRFGRTYPRNSIIFREGDTGREMFYILSGRVGMERVDSSVKKMIAEMGPGQYFGEMATLIDIRRSATARALEDSRLAVIDDKTFRNLIGDSRDVAFSMLQVFSTRLKNSNAALEDFSNLWTRLTIILLMLDHPRTSIAEHIPVLADALQKDPAEIANLIRELSDQGILITEEGLILDVARDKVLSFLCLGPLIKGSSELQKNTVAGVREDHP
ncbi:MAG: YihY family inner membrane protein [Deltaproteobacteria bacterium]|nr:YihY family inner membrane protein [Deltaproteobacteria bacterium]